MDTFTREIRAQMVRQGKTAGDMADMMGVSRPTYFNHMREPGFFTLRELRVIKRYLGLSDDIMAEAFK